MSEEGIIRDSKLTDRFDWNSRDGVTFDASREVLQTYTLQLIGPGPIVGYEHEGAEWPQYEGIAPSLLAEAQENLTDLLPEGYSVRIMEWDAKEES